MCKKVHANPPANHNKPWKPVEMLALAALFKRGVPYDDMTLVIGRTKSALYTRVSILRIVVMMSPHAKTLKGVVPHRKRISKK